MPHKPPKPDNVKPPKTLPISRPYDRITVAGDQKFDQLARQIAQEISDALGLCDVNQVENALRNSFDMHKITGFVFNGA